MMPCYACIHAVFWYWQLCFAVHILNHTNPTQQINTTTPAPQPIKPVIAPKPKNLVKPRTPGSPRGTRSTQLRQITKTRLASPPSPKMAQKSRIRAPLASPAPSTISCTSAQSATSGTSSTSSQNSSRLVRQGTFTKDEPALSNTVLVDIDVDDKKPPRYLVLNKIIDSELECHPNYFCKRSTESPRKLV